MTGLVLTEAGFDPTIIVGGRVRILGTNARLGKGEYLVAEADEYDRSFLELTPVVAVITNVEADHLDTLPRPRRHPGGVRRVRQPRAVLRRRDRLRRRRRASRRVLPRRQAPRRDVRRVAARRTCGARDIRPGPGGDDLRGLGGRDGGCSASSASRLPGRHNVANALAALAVGRELSIPFPNDRRARSRVLGRRPALREEGRARRRARRRRLRAPPDRDRGDARVRAAGLSRTAASSRSSSPTSSRGRGTSRPSSAAPSARSDVALVTDVYPSREKAHSGRHAASSSRRPPGRRATADVVYVPDKIERLSTSSRTLLQPGDLLLTMGAGDVVRLGEEYLGASMADEPLFLRRGRVAAARRRAAARGAIAVVLALGVAVLARRRGCSVGPLFSRRALRDFWQRAGAHRRNSGGARAVPKEEPVDARPRRPLADRLARASLGRARDALQAISRRARDPDRRAAPRRAAGATARRAARSCSTRRPARSLPYDPRADPADYVLVSRRRRAASRSSSPCSKTCAHKRPDYFAALSEIDVLPDGGFGMMDSIFRRPVRVLRRDASEKIARASRGAESHGAAGLGGAGHRPSFRGSNRARWAPGEREIRL